MEDFSTLKPGDSSPTGNNKIKTVVVQTDMYIVCINDDNVIDWATNEDYGDWDKDGGKVLNKVSLLENLTVRIFDNELDIHRFKCMIAEGLARIIDDRDAKTAFDILSHVEKKIITIGKEKLRISYLKSSFTSTILVILLLVMIWIMRNYIQSYLNLTVFYGILCSLGGAIGAFVSTFLRAKSYDANIEIEVKIHLFDGALRIFYGIIAGLIV